MAFNRREIVQAALLGTGLGACATAPIIAAPGASSSANGWTPPTDDARRKLIGMAEFGRKQGVSGREGVAICTHPLASAAATDVLRLGGTAADAICALSLTQCVVEPHMTTLSGVFSMLYYEAATGKYSYINGSTNAPKNHPFFNQGLSSLPALISRGQHNGELCPVPGFWGGFEAAHKAHGRLPMKTIAQPAIHYARNGFEVHPFLYGEIFVQPSPLGAVPESREMYFKDGRILNVGEKLVQKRHAQTLERLAEEGSEYFYRGEFAENYVAAVQANGGYVTMEDMEAWEPIHDEPVSGTYRDFGLVASPSPDFGGQTLIEIMNMVETLNLQSMGPAFDSPETTLKLMQIINAAYADSITGRLTGDLVSVEKAISKDYAEERVAKLKGRPSNAYEAMMGAAPPPPGSNHTTVVDAEGNVATVLHSVMSFPYSTGIYVDGVYACAGLIHLVSGVPGADMRTHSRICPNMFTKNGRPVIASGSPSISLTEAIVQNSINMLDFGLDIETSVHKPRFGGNSSSQLTHLMVEADMGRETIEYLRKQDALVDPTNPWNWTHGSFEGVRIDDTGLVSACGDPRRTAAALAV